MPRISQTIQDALNQQINRELASAYVYLAMSAWADEQNLNGAASWLRLQWQEELVHATKLVDYIAQRGGRLELKAIAKPPMKYKSLLDCFRAVLHHEEEVTVAVNEQVEEENAPAEIISMLELAGDSPSGLLIVDRQLASRTTTTGAAPA